MKKTILFTPHKIGEVIIENRFVMPAMDSNTTLPDHTFSDRSIAYYEARAKGGFGLIITEYLSVMAEGIGNPCEVGIWDDRFIENLRFLTDKVHKYPTKIFAQLHHSGLMCIKKNIGQQSAGPSAIPAINYLEEIREYSNQEVYSIVDSFIKAAERAKKAGFDGVEIHGCHGYLVAQFLSKAHNKRVDEFGGNYENRFRFAKLIISGIKEKCGNTFPIIFRLSAHEFLEQGNTINDAKIYSLLAEEAGVDALHVSTGTGQGGVHVTPHYFSAGFNIENAKAIKEIVDIPVITVGRINEEAVANFAIKSESADFVALGRQSIADSEFPKKVLEGRNEEIFQCTGCLQRCWYSGGCDESDVGVSCMMNPFSGKEGIWRIEQTDQKKVIAIIGAGPAGLQAAWILAKRGHEVTVFEKEEFPGGAYKIAAVPPHKQDLSKLIHTQMTLCKKNGVDVILNTKVNNDLLSKMKVDVIICAAGSEPIIPNIKGIHEQNVYQANTVLNGKEIISGKKVLVIGGGLIGCEVSEYLNLYSNNVSIVEMKGNLAEESVPRSRNVLIERLKKAGTEFITNTSVTEISDGLVTFSSSEQEYKMKFDVIVYAVGTKSSKTFEFESKAENWITIGDAKKARDAKYAIYEASKMSLSL
ncbi:NAD(P)/FAD-dependent oxidoreductase [Enterococcus sp. DIV0187]|uniref:NAD(P)/FAD-dependent oxidoreductase n=1 Tax=Enterococcus sp. DIV0187 TaxID=2774644 RepID=UPI003F6895A0